MHDANSVGAHTFSLALAMNLIYNFHAEDEQTIKNLVNLSVWIVPVLNADGYTYIMTSEDIRLVQDIKKNRRVSGLCPSDQEGVSLTNNYQYKYEFFQSASDSPCDHTYRGTTYSSEPEVLSMINLLNHIHDLKLSVLLESLHNTLIIPYTYLSRYVIDDETDLWFYSNLHRDMHHKVRQMGNHHDVEQTLSNGEPVDWFLGARGILSVDWNVGIRESAYTPVSMMTNDIM